MRPDQEPIVVPKSLDVERVIQSLLRPLLSKRKVERADLRAAIEAGLEKLLETLQAEATALCLLGDDGTVHVHDFHFAKYPGAGAAKERAWNLETLERLTSLVGARGRGLAGKVAASGKPLLADLAIQGADFEEDMVVRAGMDVRTVLAAPLVENDKVFGILEIINKSGEGIFINPTFSDLDLEAAMEVIPFLSSVISKSLRPEPHLTDHEAAWFTARLTKHEFRPIPEDWRPEDSLLLAACEAAQRFLIIPLRRTSEKGIEVAMANPLDLQARDSFRTRTGLEIDRVVVASESDLRRVLTRWFTPASGSGSQEARKTSSGGMAVITPRSESPQPEASDKIILLANKIIEEAHARGVSDIHLEPFEKEVKTRFRIDGYLEEHMSFPLEIHRALVSRFKIMTRSMDITENRLPQDGRIKFKEFAKEGLDIDLRVSTAPLAFGQKVVLRILDKSNTRLGLERMGFGEANLRIYREAIRKPHGMVLHVGPTGSGKTTTLYSALAELNQPDVNIQTAEDPIEYMLPNVNQMQIHKEIGLTFASALRCFLRQDPDIILVGEIRDAETAEIAVEAALTGHLIFSTLHTNDAPGTVTRLIDMGIEPFLVSSSLVIVCAQRLMRRLCPKCKIEHEPTAHEMLTLGISVAQTIFQARPGGCARCKGIGYKGRIGVHEMMTFGDETKELIDRRAPALELRKAAIRNHMIPLYDDAMEKVLQGISSIEEALATVRRD